MNKELDKSKALEPILGKDGAFVPLLEGILNAVLESEIMSIWLMRNF